MSESEFEPALLERKVEAGWIFIAVFFTALISWVLFYPITPKLTTPVYAKDVTTIVKALGQISEGGSTGASVDFFADGDVYITVHMPEGTMESHGDNLSDALMKLEQKGDKVRQALSQ